MKTKPTTVVVTWAQLEKMRVETALQRSMRIAEMSPAEKFVPTPAGWSKALGLELRRPDGRPFADANGKTTLTTAELKQVRR